MEKLLNKELVIESVSRECENILEKLGNNPLSSYSYCIQYKKFLERFLAEIKKLTLLELCDNWYYTWSVTYKGADLKLVYEENESVQELIIYSMPVRFLGVDEFAELNNLELGTVRQWIRRGKLRTAEKFGNEWRISELTDLLKVTTSRGYEEVFYFWSKELLGLIKIYDWLNDYRAIRISQDNSDKQFYIISLYKKMPKSLDFSDLQPDNSIRLYQSDKEKLEIILISRHDVYYMEK